MTSAANGSTYWFMPKRKEPELDPKEQFKRFKEAAREAGVTDSEDEFARAFKKVVKTANSPDAKRPRNR